METEKSLQLFLDSYNFQFTYKTLFISFCRLKTQSLMLVIVFYLLKSTPQYIKRNKNFLTQKKGFQNFFILTRIMEMKFLYLYAKRDRGIQCILVMPVYVFFKLIMFLFYVCCCCMKHKLCHDCSD